MLGKRVRCIMFFDFLPSTYFVHLRVVLGVLLPYQETAKFAAVTLLVRSIVHVFIRFLVPEHVVFLLVDIFRLLWWRPLPSFFLCTLPENVCLRKTNQRSLIRHRVRSPCSDSDKIPKYRIRAHTKSILLPPTLPHSRNNNNYTDRTTSTSNMTTKVANKPKQQTTGLTLLAQSSPLSTPAPELMKDGKKQKTITAKEICEEDVIMGREIARSEHKVRKEKTKPDILWFVCDWIRKTNEYMYIYAVHRTSRLSSWEL